MKRFRFQLQTVHNMRETHRDEAERNLAAAAARLRPPPTTRRSRTPLDGDGRNIRRDVAHRRA
ncbi:MAG: hypothetical protein WKF30_09775 [Pyrinomonadaceae bacterium]